MFQVNLDRIRDRVQLLLHTLILGDGVLLFIILFYTIQLALNVDYFFLCVNINSRAP